MNYEIDLVKGDGEACMLCLAPVKPGEVCIKLKIKKVKILLVTSSADECVHLDCAAQLHFDLSAALDVASGNKKAAQG